MTKGVELIAVERDEQIQKHGWSLEDDQSYEKGQLVEAAMSCLFQDEELADLVDTTSGHWWPDGWMLEFYHKIKGKDRIGQLKVAGALIAAEIDRLLMLEAAKEQK